jgi:hypothetical protein
MQSRPRQRAAVLGPVKARPVVAANAASLDRPCARRLRHRRPGRKNDGGAEQKNGFVAPPNSQKPLVNLIRDADAPPMLLREAVVGQRLLDCRCHKLGGVG